MANILEVIQTVSSVVSATAIVLASYQLLLARKQFSLQLRVWKTDHERARREKAIEIIRTFMQSVGPQWASTYKLVERFTDDQLRKLDDGSPFDIAEKEKSDVQAALANSPLDISEEKIHLTGEQSYQLRYQALNVLNSAEIVFQAWERDVADRTVIEQEMRFLYQPNDPRPTTLMKRYRDIFHGEKYYPALYQFLENLYSAPPVSPPKSLTDYPEKSH